jgi:acyl-coenzyme A thioesterase PaaI-like protein
MRESLMVLSAAALGLGLISGGGTAARAEEACAAAIAKTKSNWQAIALQPASKPGAMAQGKGEHRHVEAAVDSMRHHLRLAETLCKQGKDHEAMLHLDVVRVFLMLPEIQHPTDHRYLYKS